MYIHYSTGNNSGPRTLVRIVEVYVIGGVHFQRFHCMTVQYNKPTLPRTTALWTLYRRLFCREKVQSHMIHTCIFRVAQ